MRGVLECNLCQERLRLSWKVDECKPLDRGGTKEAFQLLVDSYERLSGKQSAVQGSPAEAGGLSRTKSTLSSTLHPRSESAGGVSRTNTRLDVESTKRVCVRVFVSVHPEGKVSRAGMPDLGSSACCR